MEDILSSIRQVIADDIAPEQTDEQTDGSIHEQANAKADEAVSAKAKELVKTIDGEPSATTIDSETFIDFPQIDAKLDLALDQTSDLGTSDLDASDLQDDIFENILELETLADESQASSKNPENPESENPVNENLVSDNLLETTGLNENTLEGIQTEDMVDILGPDEITPDKKDLASSLTEDTKTITAEVGFDPNLDLVLDGDGSDFLTTLGSKDETAKPVNLDDGLDVDLDADLDTHARLEIPDATAQNQPDDEIDLVKSLLADLMDEPATATPVDSEQKSEFANETPRPNHEAIFTPHTVAPHTVAMAEEQFLAEELIIPEPGTTEPHTPKPNTPEQGTSELGASELEQDFPREPHKTEFVDISPQDFFTQEDAHPVTANTPVTASVDEPAQDELAQNTPTQDISAPDANFQEPLHSTESADSETKPDTALADIAEAALLANEDRQTNEGLAGGISVETTTEVTANLSETDMLSKLTLLASSSSVSGEASKTEKHGGLEDESPTHDQAEIDSLLEPVQLANIPKINKPDTNEPKQEDNAMVTPLQKETLIDEQTEEITSTAFASLTSAVAEKSLLEENGPPIGELVKEALKPMLQEWLDKNLKTMVQRAVTKEIKRISSGK